MLNTLNLDNSKDTIFIIYSDISAGYKKPELNYIHFIGTLKMLKRKLINYFDIFDENLDESIKVQCPSLDLYEFINDIVYSTTYGNEFYENPREVYNYIKSLIKDNSQDDIKNSVEDLKYLFFLNSYEEQKFEKNFLLLYDKYFKIIEKNMTNICETPSYIQLSHSYEVTKLQLYSYYLLKRQMEELNKSIKIDLLEYNYFFKHLKIKQMKVQTLYNDINYLYNFKDEKQFLHILAKCLNEYTNAFIDIPSTVSQEMIFSNHKGFLYQIDDIYDDSILMNNDNDELIKDTNKLKYKIKSLMAQYNIIHRFFYYYFEGKDSDLLKVINKNYFISEELLIDEIKTQESEYFNSIDNEYHYSEKEIDYEEQYIREVFDNDEDEYENYIDGF